MMFNRNSLIGLSIYLINLIYYHTPNRNLTSCYIFITFMHKVNLLLKMIKDLSALGLKRRHDRNSCLKIHV